MIALPRPQDIAPLDPDEFVAAYLHAGMVMENEFVEEVPAVDTALIWTLDATFGLTRHPANLFGLAVMRYFRDQPDKANAFMWRFRGLQMLLHHHEMKQYIGGTGDKRKIRGAVLEVAAMQELSHKYEFEPELFFKNVREVAARMDTDGKRVEEISRRGRPVIEEAKKIADD